MGTLKVGHESRKKFLLMFLFVYKSLPKKVVEISSLENFQTSLDKAYVNV